MHSFDEKMFFDKVYACWMGKNIGGTLGGPLEGRMELLDIHGYTQQFVEAVENDDLDLQLVNLHCVEEYGGCADMALLSQEWLEHVHFQFDEYGHALTNMRRGIGSPLSGRYNNFFIDCMGSPIRSEIWAVLCAGMPDLAAYYAYQDASVDHAGGEGLYGEVFFAVLESMAFVTTDKDTLIKTALRYLPDQSVVKSAVYTLLSCHKRGLTYQEARKEILDRYAGENFTYAPVNVAFTLVGWLYAEGFTQQMLTTINCGYDTDCTVATLGSLLGILYGTAYIDPMWTEPLGERIITSRPITGFSAPATITELTNRTIAARRLIQEHYAQQSDISAYRIPYNCSTEEYMLPLSAVKDHDLSISLSRPIAFAPGEEGVVTVTTKNLQPVAQTLELYVQIEGFSCLSPKASLKLAPGETRECDFRIVAPLEKAPLWQGYVEIRRFHGKLLWNTQRLPLHCLPTMDWRCTRGSTETVLRCKENQLLGAKIEVGETVILETTLRTEEDAPAVLKLCTASPIKVWINDVLSIDCPERTAVIPAYHRADPRKCCALPTGTKEWHLRVEVGAGAPEFTLYSMVVDPDFYWAYRIDSTFSL